MLLFCGYIKNVFCKHAIYLQNGILCQFEKHFNFFKDNLKFCYYFEMRFEGPLVIDKTEKHLYKYGSCIK